jgi:hypothetical protein
LFGFIVEVHLKRPAENADHGDLFDYNNMFGDAHIPNSFQKTSTKFSATGLDRAKRTPDLKTAAKL